MTNARHTTHCHLGCCTGLPAALPGHTPWLCGSTQPVQPGVYLRLYRRATAASLFCMFDDEWFGGFYTAAEAGAWPHAALEQHRPWCGLLTPPPCGYGSNAMPRTPTPPGAMPC